MHLTAPTLQYKKEYLDALHETESEKGETQLTRPAPGQTFEDFVKELLDFSEGKNLPPGYVPASMFWLIDGGQVIGRVQIRHTLNEHLLNYGGHIGYYIRPSKRRMGYGTAILRFALEEAKKRNLKEILLTCDEDNVGSQKIIEACGGTFEDRRGQGGKTKMRYWIRL